MVHNISGKRIPLQGFQPCWFVWQGKLLFWLSFEQAVVIISAAQCLFNAVCFLLTERREGEGPVVRKAGRTRRRTHMHRHNCAARPAAKQEAGTHKHTHTHRGCVTSHSYLEVTPPRVLYASKWVFSLQQSPTLQIAPWKGKLMAPFHVRALTFTV